MMEIEEKEPLNITIDNRIIVLVQSGISNPLTIYNKVKQYSDISLSTVERKVKQFKETGTIQRKQYTREPKIFNEQVKQDIINYFEENNNGKDFVFSTDQLKQDLEIEAGKTQTCQVLKDLNISYQRINNKPMINETHIQKILQFAKRHRYNDWDQALFVDETSIWTIKFSNFVWQFNDESCDMTNPKNTQKIHIFAGIAIDGMTDLYIFEQNLDGQHQSDIIGDFLIKEAQQIFNGKKRWRMVQDQDPKHNSNKAQQAYEDLNITVLKDFPPGSLDLNPIEHLWALLKGELRKNLIKSKDEIIQTTQKIWSEIDLDIVNNPFYA